MRQSADPSLPGPTLSAGQRHRQIWALSWPVILANLSVPMVGVVDTAVMGHQPEASGLAAVAVGASVLSALYWMFGFLRMGTTGLAAQAWGAGNPAELKRIAARAAVVALALGLLLLLLLPLLLWLRGSLFQVSAAVADQADAYISWRILGAPALLLQLVSMGMLFALQRSGMVLLLTLVFNGINVALDLLFTLGFGWGAAGVAAGTAISEWLAALLGVVLALRAMAAVGVRSGWPDQVLNPAALRGLFDVSANLVIRTFFVQLPFLLTTILGARLGEVVLAANAVLMQFFMVLTFAMDGFAHTAEALAGHAWGGRRSAALRQAVRDVSCQALLLAVFGTAGLWLAAGPLVMAMTSLPEVAAAVHLYLPWVVLLPLTAVWAFVLDGVFIGTTRTRLLRNNMALAAVAYLLLVGGGLLLSQMQDQGRGEGQLDNRLIWLGMHLFMAARALLLARRLPWLYRACAAPA